MLHVISLGAGVQSSTMALMAAHGEITPMPDCAIFADTGWEPAHVYEWLERLEQWLPFPVHHVSNGDLRADQIGALVRAGSGERSASLPYFTSNEGAAREGRLRRQCTKEYKIWPIEGFIRRQLLRLEPRQRAPRVPAITQWRGISADEAHRMKPSGEKWMIVRYPLAMEKGMSRGDCLAWLMRNGYPQPQRSACIGCPYHSDHEWLDMRDNRPGEWNDAVAFDNAIRKHGGMRGETYLHRSCVPLERVEFKADWQIDMFGNECEGMCGV